MNELGLAGASWRVGHGQQDAGHFIGFIDQLSFLAGCKTCRIVHFQDGLGDHAIEFRNQSHFTREDHVMLFHGRAVEARMASGLNLRNTHPQSFGGACLMALQAQACHVEMIGRFVFGRLAESRDVHGLSTILFLAPANTAL